MRAQLRRHFLLHPHEHLIHVARARKSAAQEKMREVLLIPPRVRLRENAALGMPEERNLPQPQALAYRLYILHHVLERIAARILELFRFS
jgi:hypothetical protein